MICRGYMMRLHRVLPRRMGGVLRELAKGTLAISTFLCLGAPAMYSDADLLCPSHTDRLMCGDGTTEKARGVIELDYLLRITLTLRHEIAA